VRNEAKAFLQQHKADWLNHISAASLASLKQHKYNNPQPLPLTSGLEQLRKFQEEMMTVLTLELKTSHVWRTLAERVYSRILIFNKRRGGETAKLQLSDYENRPKWEEVASDALVEN
jgi:hypothetical protein